MGPWAEGGNVAGSIVMTGGGNRRSGRGTYRDDSRESIWYKYIVFAISSFLNGNPKANAPLVGSRTGENGRAPQICHKFHSHRMKLVPDLLTAAEMQRVYTYICTYVRANIHAYMHTCRARVCSTELVRPVTHEAGCWFP